MLLDTNGVELVKTVTVDTSSTPVNYITNLRESRLIGCSDGGFIGFGLAFGASQIVIAKYDRAGAERWVRRHAHPGIHIQPFDIVEAQTGFFITGLLQLDNFKFDVFLCKVDKATGDLEWFRQYGHPFEDEYGLCLVNDEESVVVGATKQRNLGRTTWLIGLNGDGDMQWQWESGPDTEGYIIDLLKVNGMWAYVLDILTPDGYNGWYRHGELIVRDSAQDLLWRKEYGMATHLFNGLSEIATDSSSCLIVAGQFLETDLGKNGTRRGWVSKVDLNGTVNWTVRDTAFMNPNGGSVSYLSGVATDPNGNVYAVGDGRDFREDPPKYHGWLLKISPDGCVDTICYTTSIDGGHKIIQPIKIYPNPFTSTVTLDLSNMDKTSVFEVSSVTGIPLYRKDLTISGELLHLDLSHLPPGVLIYTLSDESGNVKSGKLVKVD